MRLNGSIRQDAEKERHKSTFLFLYERIAQAMLSSID